jgi:hypothetical protein
MNQLIFFSQIMKYRLLLAVYLSLPLQGDPFTSLAGATQYPKAGTNTQKIFSHPRGKLA